jgi:DNA-binding CsgD family transcriptional regulator/PAS domain-containing protein
VVVDAGDVVGAGSATIVGRDDDMRTAYITGGGGPARSSRLARAPGGGGAQVEQRHGQGMGAAGMDAGTDFDRVLGLVYDAALDPERWPEALGGLDRILRGSTCLAEHDSATQRRDGFTSGELMAKFLGAYNEHYARINPLWPATVAAPVGTVRIDREVAGRDGFGRGEFYNDFGRRIGLHAGMAVKVLDEGNTAAVVVVARRPDEGEFGRADAELLGRLAPHLRRAVQVNQRLSVSRGVAAATADALDHLPQGAVLADASGRVLFANRAAREILATADGLHAGPDGLRADSAAQTDELRRRIGRAALPPGGEGAPAAGALSLARRSGRRPLSVLVAPCRREGSWDLARAPPAALVFVVDPERAAAVPADRLRRLYGLTRAEAHVALAVLRGDGLQAAADALGVTLATVKTHLQHVFGKTGTQRQTELMGLILAGSIGTVEG